MKAAESPKKNMSSVIFSTAGERNPKLCQTVFDTDVQRVALTNEGQVIFFLALGLIGIGLW